jgi:hypothetical protein
MTHGYIVKWLEGVKRRSNENNAAYADIEAEELLLTVKIHEWWTALPESERYKPITMSEFVNQFQAAPAKIGTALHLLGWVRKRKWGAGSYARYWLHQ